MSGDLANQDLSQVPAGPLPSNIPESNFIDPPSRVWQPRLAVFITLPIAIIFVLLRVYTRFNLRHRFGADDHLIVAAGLGAIGYAAVMLKNTHDDVVGRHIWDIPLIAVMGPSILQESFAIAVVNLFANCCLKISLCLLYRRIFYPSMASNIMIWTCIGFIVIAYPAMLAAWTYFCVPHSGDGGWTSMPFTTRVSIKAPIVALAISVVHSLTDFYILAIPLTAVSSLNMSTRKKVAISALFLTGLCICGLSLAGVVTRVRLYQSNGVDSFWPTMPAYAFSVVEINIGIFCACMPVVFSTIKSAVAQSRSVLDSWKTSFLPSARSTPSNSKGGTTGSDERQGNVHELPRVPRGTLGTLASFIRGGRRSRADRTMATADMEMPAYSELRSMDTEYHKHMVR